MRSTNRRRLGRVLVVAATIVGLSAVAGTAVADPRLVTTLAVGDYAFAVAANPSTHRAYVANRNASTVSVIDTNADRVVATLSNAGTGLADVAVDHTTNRVYVVNQHPSNTISVLDGSTHERIATIRGFGNPYRLAVNTSTRRAFVAQSNGYVAIVDLAGNRIESNVYLGDLVHDVAVNARTNKAYFSAYYRTWSVLELDVASGSVRTALYLPGLRPRSVAVNANFNKLFVSNSSGTEADLVSLDLHDGTIRRHAGDRGPLTANNATNRVYMAGTTMTVVDALEEQVVARVRTTSSAADVSIDTSLQKVVTANGTQDTATIVADDAPLWFNFGGYCWSC